MADLTKDESAVARQYEKWQEAKAAADVVWATVDKEIRGLVRVAKIGRKTSAIVRISENRGVRITNKFRGEDKVFAPAFARKWEIKEVPLDVEA